MEGAESILEAAQRAFETNIPISKERTQRQMKSMFHKCMVMNYKKNDPKHAPVFLGFKLTT